ncbi:arylsulfatase [Sphingobium estronivorans]|uniref:arylsulfatase n=1 Tax=Sphingobium estronivorans TaxID=1577690 RepID=UPI001238FB02|nr:arylsulfatase [Sphingobium estronivorans]
MGLRYLRIGLIGACFYSVAPGAVAAAHTPATGTPPSVGPNATSTPAKRAEQARPNIIYVLLDDTGFSDLGSFGSEIHTPNLDRLAAEGLRYNNFHTRAICSPSRAALLTGRNSHSVGMGNLTHIVTDAPGKKGEISHGAATVAEMLRLNGYATMAVGKWHLAPLSAGRKDQWPVQRGFDQYYGFLGGMTDQFHPDLTQDNTSIDPPATPGYHLTTDLVDHSIAYIKRAQALNSAHPFFLYFATGATHAPHQAPAEYIDKYKTTYARGWDEIRQERFARQKELGIIPKSAVLPARNADVRAWDTLNSDEKAVAARLQAAYAGFLEHTDAQIGRLLSYLEQSGLRENTLIIVASDNGASSEGEEHGTYNETYNVGNLARKPESLAEQVKHLDDVGTDRTFNNYPRGWAMVGNTPFRDYKSTVDEGGLRTPLIISWPHHIADPGAIRRQFVDIIDITPTALAVSGTTAPDNYAGIPQQPIEGASIAATFGKADTPSPRNVQYFELWGKRAIWSDGWKAMARHQPGTPFDADRWSLYDTARGITATQDVGSKFPQRLDGLKDLWLTEARKYKVLPLDDRGVRDNAFSGVQLPPRTYHFTPGVGILPFGTDPMVTNRSFSIDAKVNRISRSTEGVLIASGDYFGGYALYVRGNRLYFDFNDFGRHMTLRSDRELPLGPATLSFSFDKTEDFRGQGTLRVNGDDVAQMDMAMTPAVSISWAGTDIGRDIGSNVTSAYSDKYPFEFPKEQFLDVTVSTKN